MAEKKSSKKAVVSKVKVVEVEKKGVSAKNKVQKDNAPKKVVETKVVEEKKVDTSFADENRAMWKDVAKKVWDVFFWVAFIIILSIWIVDYIRVNKEKDPMFCLKNETIEFDDGTVSKCTGLGYKVYNYDRESLDKGIEFGPFFAKMKEPDND